MKNSNNINWQYVYWFNLILLIICSVSALGLAIAAILTQPSKNMAVSTINSSGAIQVTSNDCNTLFRLEILYDDMKVILPEPKNITGCSFFFVYDRKDNNLNNAEIAFTAGAGEFIGMSLVDNVWTNIQSKTVSLGGVSANQFAVISDGMNYRVTGPAVGLSNMS